MVFGGNFTGADTVAATVTGQHIFYLDSDGSDVFTAVGVQAFAFGISGDLPIVGN